MLKSATVHWLRHTGISNDGAITDKYIDVERDQRAKSAKKKKTETSSVDNLSTESNALRYRMDKDIRWKQRFENFEKAFLFLEKATKLGKYDELQAAGLVHSFEFTFELAWKTLKDHLDFQGITVQSPREAIKESFSEQLIEDGHLWIEMLEKSNELTHTYSEEQSQKTVKTICEKYFFGIKQVYLMLKANL